MNFIARKFQAGFVLALLVSLPAALCAQTPRIDRIDILEAGIYSAEITKKIPDSNVPGGFKNEIGGFKLIKRTTTVPARLGTNFYFKYRVAGSPLKEKVDIRKVVRLPAAGMRGPKTGEVFYRYERLITVAIGESRYTGYTFEDAWEMVPGTWTIELWYQDRKLAEQSFTLQ